MKSPTHIALLFLFSILLILPGKAQNCDVEIPSDVFYIEGSSYEPGTVICLLPGSKEYLSFKDINGTESQPVTIINKGGEVLINTDHFYGIKFDNCSHIIFRGDGVDEIPYGIKVTRVGNGTGMSLDNMTTNIEVMNIEIAFTAIAGIYAKTEPYQGDCDNLITRDKFTMYDVKIHDCYLHDIADEGFYVGSAKYTGQTIHQCDNITVLPHVIEGAQIYNNIIENTGWDGIQVSSAITDCDIFGNVITGDSYAEVDGQMSGIIIGGGSRCDCYNNQIYDGKGDGIDVFGMGFMKIYNNLIVNAGKTYKPDDPYAKKHGIYLGYVEGAISPGATFKFFNNTIISPKSFGINYANPTATMGYISNNLITDPGYPGEDKVYINIPQEVDESKVERSNNFLTDNNTTPKFLDRYDYNFDLQPGSPAVNYGKSLAAEGVTFDILNRARPFHTYFDAGAFECHNPYAGVDEFGQNTWKPYPVPANNKLFVPILENTKWPVMIKITSLTGKILYSNQIDSTDSSDGSIELDLRSIPNGNYIISLYSGNRVVSSIFTFQ